MVRNHVIGIGVVLVALVAVGGVFAFARPTYHPRVTTRAVNMASEHHYKAAHVVGVFARQGIVLRPANTQSGTVYYTDTRPGEKDDAFLVTIFNPKVTVNFGTAGPKPLYVKRLGNVLVTYGGHNAPFAARVATAASAIAP
jgi:hypothetical protein